MRAMSVKYYNNTGGDMDAAYELSKFIVDTRFEDLPHEAIEVAKKGVLNSLATTLDGNTDEAVKKLYELVKA